jgi:hypothetical protein
MIDVQQLREVFQDKLAKTGNLDDAFIKAVWVAYQQGLADAGIVKNYNSGEKRCKVKQDLLLRPASMY